MFAAVTHNICGSETSECDGGEGDGHQGLRCVCIRDDTPTGLIWIWGRGQSTVMTW